MNAHAWMDIVPYALAVSVVVGGVQLAVLYGVFELGLLQRNAALRYVVRFSALVCLTAAAPLFAVSAYRHSLQVPLVSVRTNAAVPLARLVSNARRPEVRSRPAHIADAARTRSAPSVDIAHALTLVWASGFLLAGIRLACGALQVRRLKARAELVGTRCTERGPVSILASHACVMPMALGYIRPAIVIPNVMAQARGDADTEHIVLHELEHLRRFDDVACIVQAACLSALWFNPFAYALARDIAIEREMACDEAVVSRAVAPAKYAKTLWKIATSAPGSRLSALVAPFTSRSHAIARVLNVLDKRPRRSIARWQLLVAASVAPALAFGVAAAAPSKILASPAVSFVTAVRLTDGEILAIGGRRADGSALGSAQLYARNGRRIAVIPMRVARWDPQATLLKNGDVLVTGGMTPDGPTPDVELYRAAHAAFRRLAPLHVARAYHSATLLANGDVLVAAGRGLRGRLVAQTEIYRPDGTGASQFTADGEGRLRQTALLIDDGNVLMLGGEGNSACAFIYDVRHHRYRAAGTLIRAGAETLTFWLPDGRVVTHALRGV